LAIATVLTAYTAALTLSNQAFADKDVFGQPGLQSSQPGEEAHPGNNHVLTGQEEQLGKVLTGQVGKILGKAGLGDVCLSCFGH
jgi:hypothetical protein